MIMSGLSPIDSYPVRFVYNVVQAREQLPYLFTSTKPRKLNLVFAWVARLQHREPVVTRNINLSFPRKMAV